MKDSYFYKTFSVERGFTVANSISYYVRKAFAFVSSDADTFSSNDAKGEIGVMRGFHVAHDQTPGARGATGQIAETVNKFIRAVSAKVETIVAAFKSSRNSPDAHHAEPQVMRGACVHTLAEAEKLKKEEEIDDLISDIRSERFPDLYGINKDYDRNEHHGQASSSIDIDFVDDVIFEINKLRFNAIEERLSKLDGIIDDGNLDEAEEEINILRRNLYTQDGLGL